MVSAILYQGDGEADMDTISKLFSSSMLHNQIQQIKLKVKIISPTVFDSPPRYNRVTFKQTTNPALGFSSGKERETMRDTIVDYFRWGL